MDKSIDLPSISGNEISFKFTVDEQQICTIDDIELPPPPPPPTKKAPQQD